MTIFTVLLQVSAPYKYFCPIIAKQYLEDRKQLNAFNWMKTYPLLKEQTVMDCQQSHVADSELHACQSSFGSLKFKGQCSLVCQSALHYLIR